jgi:hypothetical protein
MRDLGVRSAIALLALASAAVVAACGDGSESGSGASEGDRGPGIQLIGAASLAELVGPWRSEPLGLDPVMAGRIAEACARDMAGPGGAPPPAGVPPQVIDVRGAGVAIVRVSGPTAAMGCDALQITPTGDITGAGGGWSTGQAEVLPAIGATEFADVQRSTITGGDLRVTGWSVIGRAGAGIAAVTVSEAGGPVVVATLQNGWFAAWWPAPAAAVGNGGGIQPAALLRGFDSFGNQLVEQTLDRGM